MCSLAVEDLRAAPPALNRTDSGSWVAGVLAIAIFAALSSAVAATSVGFLEADGCTHYLYARFALEEPALLVNVWGRPLFTALYAFPSATFGLPGARMLSLLIAIACGIVTMLIARGQGHRFSVLALIFTLGQPLVFLHSFSELTELPFATLLGLAFLAYQRRKWLAMSILLALAPLARPEGFGFLVLGMIALIAHRRWWWILILPIPLILWNHAGWIISGKQTDWWRWLPSNWPYAPDSLYASGNPFHFVALLPAVVSPLVFPAMLIGAWNSLTLKWESHRARCQLLIALIPFMILIGHSILYATGKLASSGEIRYMLIVAPFWALLSARGWERIFERMSWRAPVGFSGIAVLSAGLANVAYPVIPLIPQPEYVQSERFVEWYRVSGVEKEFPRICTSQMLIHYMLDLNPLDEQRVLDFRRDRLRDPTPGTILIWDPMYSLFNADAERSIHFSELLEMGWQAAPDDFLRLGSGWKILTTRREPSGESMR